MDNIFIFHLKVEIDETKEEAPITIKDLRAIKDIPIEKENKNIKIDNKIIIEYKKTEITKTVFSPKESYLIQKENEIKYINKPKREDNQV